MNYSVQNFICNYDISKENLCYNIDSFSRYTCSWVCKLHLCLENNLPSINRNNLGCIDYFKYNIYLLILLIFNICFFRDNNLQHKKHKYRCSWDGKLHNSHHLSNIVKKGINCFRDKNLFYTTNKYYRRDRRIFGNLELNIVSFNKNLNLKKNFLNIYLHLQDHLASN